MADVLHQAVTLAETKARRGDILVTVDLAPDLPALEGDHHQLCQVFTNLLTNAFEALDGHGVISITAKVVALEQAFVREPREPHTLIQTLVIDVADDGPGVPPDLTDSIFNPFFTTKAEGSGLGLAIVRKIVDAHDGRIDVNSSPEAGTRFRITLPITSASAWFK